MIRRIRQRLQRWRERRDPTVLNARLRREGILGVGLGLSTKLSTAPPTTVNLRLDDYLAQERAARAERKASHDQTGEHEWLEVTVMTDPTRRFICNFCDAVKTEPHGSPFEPFL